MRIEKAPFPPLSLEDGIWQGRDSFPEWDGLQNRSGPYASLGSRETAGEFDVMVGAPGGEAEDQEPSPMQVAAYAHLKARGSEMAEAVLDSVLVCARGLDPAYGLSSDLHQVALRNMVGLSVVHILDVARDGLAYLGFELGCDWDEEHGCGVMTHGERVVAVGGADTSFLEWIAEKDGGMILG